MYIEELLVIIQNWKQPRCPTSRTDMYILKYSLDGILLSKKNEALLYAGTWIFLTQKVEQNKSDAKKNCRIYDSVYIYFKNRQKLFYGLEVRIESTFGEEQGGSDWEGLEEAFLGADKVLHPEWSVDFMGRITLYFSFSSFN